MRVLLHLQMRALSLFIIYLQTVHSIQFTSQTYIAVVSDNTKPGSRIQQVTAIPTHSFNNITYSASASDYVHVTESGSVIWKYLLPFNDDDVMIEVKARDEAGEDVTSNLLLKSSRSCPPVEDSLQISIPENVNTPLPILYLDTACQGAISDIAPSLTERSSYFTIEDNVLYVHRLDYSAAQKANTSLMYNNQKIEVEIDVLNEVDMSPYTSLRPRESLDFVQLNRTIDSDQYTKPRDKNLIANFDKSGNSSKWRIEYSDNNYVNGQPLLTASITRRPGKAFIGVTYPEQWPLESTIDIDVVLIDGNIDKQMAINNKITFRFRFIYIDYDELHNIILTESYNVDVSRASPDYAKVLEISHNYSASLTFSLNYKTENSADCRPFLDITRHQGIIYMSDSEAISTCLNNEMIEYQITVKQFARNRTSTLKVKLFGAGVNNMSSFNSAGCATNTDELACNTSAGIGSAQCMWSMIETIRSNYSTCIANAQCGDGVCSELETLSAHICPQDCLESNKWSGQTPIPCNKHKLGLCGASGVCYCRDDCQCRPQSHIDIVYIDEDENIPIVNITVVKEVRPVLEEKCGVGCIIGIAVTAAIMIIITSVLSLWCRYQALSRHKKVANVNAWRVNGTSLRLPEFTPCPDYEGSTPSTVMSVISDWPSMHPFYHIANNYELYDEKWELPRDSLVIGDYIGEGEFGRVMEAKYRKSPLDHWNPAAVKMLKDGASRVEFTDLLSEYTLLKEVDHPNVIKLIGAATLNGPFHLVVEFCEHGSLKNYLRHVRTQEPIYMNGATQFYTEHSAELMGFSWQISKGMQYLSDMKLVHRDLATRNILIAANNVIKISDFGMTKDIYEEEAYKKKGQGRIPVKWMAPESLYHQIYTTKSDVWSYGIVLWEVATLGATPYPGIPAERMYHLLQEGYRMDRPETCSLALYTLMRKCWEFEPLIRPSFKDIKISLEHMLQDQDDYLDLSVAQAQRLCHGSASISTTSEDDSSMSETPHQLTVALLHNSNEPKMFEDYMVSSDDRGYNERRPLRYTTLEFTEED